jgi:hypothetical protein
MRNFVPTTVAALLLVSCSNGRDAAVSVGTERDLNLGAAQAAGEPLVLSSVERQSMTRPASKGQGKVRLVAEVKTAVPRANAPEETSVATDLVAAPALEVVPDAPAAPPAEAQAGAGHALAPGQTVASIPAVAMGSGDPPRIQTIARGGSGVMVRIPDDNCAPHTGMVAVNRVYQPSFRRF